MKIRISKTGEVSYIYCDELASLSKGGSIVRVSNVEPTQDGMWQATMLEDGVKLPACRLRSEALALEVEYLERKLFGNALAEGKQTEEEVA